VRRREGRPPARKDEGENHGEGRAASR
jgi:hypothetical protein